MDEEEVPELRDDQVLIKTTKSLVSVGTETSCNTGKTNWNTGRHGYSNVGRVIRVGSAVKDIAVGERVATAGNHTDYLAMSRQDDDYGYHRIPEGVADEEAVFMVLGTVAMHVVERADITLGRPVVVIGQGTVGQIVRQLAVQSGAGKTIAVEKDPVRRELARHLGADDAIAPSKDELDKALRGVIPGTAAPVFIDVSGCAAVVSWCCEVAPLRSRIVMAGNYMQEATIRPLDIVEREMDLVGAHQPKCPNDPVLFYPYNRKFNRNFILESIRRKKLRVRELSDGVITPGELLAFYDAVRDGKPRLYQPIVNWE